MSDGSRLRQSWAAALNDAQSQFRSLLVSSASPAWKRVPTTVRDATPAKDKSRPGSDESEGIIHRRATKTGDVYRIVMDVAVDADQMGMEPWKSVLITPEMRKEWDPAVESAHLVEMFDPQTRIAKTDFTLGWPANPRDSITISRTFVDSTTLIDVSTSLPRSPDEPSYLRPAPPFVRSHVHLFAWCIQALSSPPSTPGIDRISQKKVKKLRITCFWQHDLKAMFSFGTPTSSTSALSQHLTALVLGLVKTVKRRGVRIPILTGYGLGVGIENVTFQIGREALTIEYHILPEDEDANETNKVKGMDEVRALKERKRLERSVECSLPATQGWDIQVTTRASSDDIAKLPWTVHAIRTSNESETASSTSSHLLFRINHSPLTDNSSLLKVKIVIELAGGSNGIRLNGSPHPISSVESRDPVSSLSSQLLADVSSVSGMSIETASSAAASMTSVSSSPTSTTPSRRVPVMRTSTERTHGADKSVLTLVRRNYVYFASLLQEPEAKWKPLAEARGVTVTQLDSIDPTLVVYRAEAVFVGVGLWDLLSTVITPGAKVQWDKSYDDAVLLEDVNELTDLWHYKTKAAWPVNARDTVLLKTSYKSPTSVHVFSFSTDDKHLFPSIPPTDPATIRTQVDLHGWAIEALSPTTTALTLIEQSDPKGWSNKSSIPQQMIAALAGTGEFAIKYGGPPVATRLGGARATSVRYDHEKGTFRIEYRGSESRLKAGTTSNHSISNGTPSASETDSNEPTPIQTAPAPRPFIECELRCDIETWAQSIELVIDPPAQSISCLKRHRLSDSGGGLWITIEHDAVFAADGPLRVIVRKGAPIGPTKEKGAVVVNGVKVKVDVEELPENEVKVLTKRKRVKPVRIPLDQPPVLGVIRRRRAEWDEEGDGNGTDASDATSSTPGPKSTILSTSAPRFASPLGKFFSSTLEQATSATTAAMTAATAAVSAPYVARTPTTPPSIEKPPIQHLLDPALLYLRELHANSTLDGWTPVSNTGTFTIHRKLEPKISATIPLYRGEKVVEGVTAEEISTAASNYECRKQWDDRFDSATIFEQFGAGMHTGFLVTKGGFPFRDRGFFIASLVARLLHPATSRQDTSHAGQATSGNNSSVIFHVTSSVNPQSAARFASAKYNSYNLPVGSILIQGWILETLDPYTAENYAIPSTRCTYISSVDYAGSVPVAYNNSMNAALPRAILAVEAYLKNTSPLPLIRLPAGSLAIPVDQKEIPAATNNEEEWSLERNDDQRVLVSTHSSPITKTWRGTVILSPVSSGRPPLDDTTPRPSKISIPGRRDSLGSPSPPPRMGTMSSSPSPSGTMRDRKTSVSVLKALGSPGPRATIGHSPSRSLSSHNRDRSGSLRRHGDASDDFVIAELILDAKTYPSGVEIQSVGAIRSPDGASSQILQNPISLEPLSDVKPEVAPFPINFTVYTLPTPPTSPDRQRYLVRASVPTAVYEAPMLEDPLTGEMRGGVPKPPWLLSMEDHGAIVDIVINPTSNTRPGDKKFRVVASGVTVDVQSEKKSLSALGRVELEDDRADEMAVLVRVPPMKGASVLPKRMIEPIAVARHLYGKDQDVPAREAEITPKGDTIAENTVSSSVQTPPQDHTLPDPQPPGPPGAGWIGFFNTTQNFLRIAGSSNATNARSAPSVETKPGAPSATSAVEAFVPPTDNSEPKPPAETSDTTLISTDTLRSRAHAYTFPLSTLILVALISFLLGSLIRSLLSPADFIYASDAQELTDGAGWREVRRLVELKYIVGGWDLVIAIVRRH